MALYFGRVPLWLWLQLSVVLILLFLPRCKTTHPSHVVVPKEPEPYLARIVDNGASSQNGYFLQKNAILKYGHEFSSGGARNVERKRLTATKVRQLLGRLRDLGVSDWLEDYGAMKWPDGEGGFYDVAVSTWELHLLVDGTNPAVKSRGSSMYPTNDDPKKAVAYDPSDRYGAVWRVFSDAFEAKP